METMKRRDFLRTSALTTGGLLLGASTALGASEAGRLMTYQEVDTALFAGINRAKNPAVLTKLEQLHVPVIDAPKTIRAGEPFNVSVTIGEIVHPMVPVHYIHWVALYAGNAPVGRAEFQPTLNLPKATFTLTLEKPVTLIVREFCNIHGLWESRRDLTLS
jgi:superoxide reductase